MTSTPVSTRARLALVLAIFAAHAACSSDPDARGGAPLPSADAGATSDGSTPGDDAATNPLPGGAITGTLEAIAAGSSPTTAKLGTFTPTRGSAQLRTNPNGGAVLTVSLGEDTAAPPSRAFEVGIFDDTGTVDAAERFQAAAAESGFALRRARVEGYPSDGKSYQTSGDGEIVVDAIDATHVTLTFVNVAQVAQDAGGNDVFVLTGTVKVPLFVLPQTSGGTANLTISGVENEPISGDAPTASTTPPTLTSAATLGDTTYPYVGDRRTLSFGDTQGGIARSFRISFPSGHLPHVGQGLPLSSFDRVQVTYYEGASLTGAADERVWEADQGKITVDRRTPTSITLSLVGARMQSESPAAKGLFVVDGSVTVPVSGE